MAYNEDLANRLRLALACKDNVAEKRMFGGIAMLLNGNLLLGVGNDALIIRIDPEQSEESLKQPYVSKFRHDGRVVSGWLRVGKKAVENQEQLDAWITKATQFVEQFSPK